MTTDANTWCGCGHQEWDHYWATCGCLIAGCPCTAYTPPTIGSAGIFRPPFSGDTDNGGHRSEDAECPACGRRTECVGRPCAACRAAYERMGQFLRRRNKASDNDTPSPVDVAPDSAVSGRTRQGES